MQVYDATLSQKAELIKISITGSTQISSRVTSVVSKLKESAAAANEKPTILALTAKARYANKLISVVEIAKRELTKNNTKCYQYNALSSEMSEIERSPFNGAHADAEQGAGDSDDAFETMGSHSIVGSKKKRAVPVMTIYLSSNSVRELKLAYGFD